MKHEPPAVEFIRSQYGEWLDVKGIKRKGHIYEYNVRDERSGRWEFVVRLSDEAQKAEVRPIKTDKSSWLHDAICHKTDVFQVSVNPAKYYHPLGIGYVKEDRYSYRRVSKLDEVPKEIRDNFDLAIYKTVSPKPSSRFSGKLVVLVGKNEPEKMVLCLRKNMAGFSNLI